MSSSHSSTPPPPCNETRTASHFMKLDSCQQRVCSPDPPYAKYIQYHVWKQCCFRIQLLTPSSVSLTTSLLPTLSPLFWLTPKLDSVFALLFFSLSVCPLFSYVRPFFLSLSISLPAHPLPWYLSCTHLAVTMAPQCESRAQWFISEDCTHYRGQRRGRTHGTCLRIFFPSASLKQQMTATDCAKFPQPAEFLHLNHTLSCLKDCSGWF